MSATDTPSPRPRVAVVFGGRSSEHAISCVTAAGVLRAIDRAKYDVVPVGIAHDGRWVLAADDPDRLEISGGRLPEVDGDAPGVLVPTTTADRSLTVHEPGEMPRELGEVDVVLPLLHGPFGEDGTIQGMLELAGVPYVGSGVLASAAGMDKHYMKVLLAGAGLPVGPYTTITDRLWRTDKALALETVASLGLPVFVKPARAGSSMGITKVTSADAVEAAVEAAREHDPKVVVEGMIEGREIEVAVLQGLGDAPHTVSEPGEIEVLSGHDFYDFAAKYLPEEESNVRLSVPADLSREQADAARDLAARTFDAMDCEGLARVDLFLTRDGFVVNEVNTMPGFTSTSMYPKLMAHAGVSYPELVDRLLQLALARRTGLR